MPTITQATPRCDRHAGELYPSRCVECDELEAEWRALQPRVCERHPIHFIPCERCASTSTP